MKGKSNPGEILLIIYLKTISWEGKGESSLFPIHRSVLQLELKKLPSLALCGLDAGRAERRAGLHNKQGGRRTAQPRSQELSVSSADFTGSNLKGIRKHRVRGVGTTIKSIRRRGGCWETDTWPPSQKYRIKKGKKPGGKM